jgi:hypothetical protein
LDPKGDKADHILVVPASATDLICLSPSKSDSEDGGEVYMVRNGEELLDNSVEEIQWETDIELAHAARLSWEVERGKRHNGMHDDSGASEDKPGDGTPVRRHHLKFNSRLPVD